MNGRSVHLSDWSVIIHGLVHSLTCNIAQTGFTSLFEVVTYRSGRLKGGCYELVGVMNWWSYYVIMIQGCEGKTPPVQHNLRTLLFTPVFKFTLTVFS